MCGNSHQFPQLDNIPVALETYCGNMNLSASTFTPAENNMVEMLHENVPTFLETSIQYNGINRQCGPFVFHHQMVCSNSSSAEKRAIFIGLVVNVHGEQTSRSGPWMLIWTELGNYT